MSKILLIETAAFLAALSHSLKCEHKIVTIDSGSQVAEEMPYKMASCRWDNKSKGEKKRQRSEWNRAMKGHRK